MEFLKIYLEESRVGSSKAISYTNEKRNKEAEALLREVDGFFVITNLLWALWSMSQSVTTKITFGHLVINWFSKSKYSKIYDFPLIFQRYAEERMQFYFHYKELCVSTFNSNQWRWNLSVFRMGHLYQIVFFVLVE